MCLTLSSPKFRSRNAAQRAINAGKILPKVAKEDIIVYKKIYKTGKSLHKGMVYRKDYHYYQSGKQFTFSVSLYWGRLDRVEYRPAVEKGLHSFKREPFLTEYQGHKLKVVKMIIPKGARYYENNDEYCSNQLIYP